MNGKFLNNRDLLDHAIDKPRDESPTSGEDDPTLQGAVRFADMVRESTFAPFRGIEPAPRFLEKRKAPIVRRRKILFITSGLSTAGIAAMIAIALMTGIIDLSPKSTILAASGDVRINNTSASAGSYVKKGDSITTGQKSFAVLIYSGKVTVSLGENSALAVSRLVDDRRPAMTVDQSYGSSFTSILPGSADFTIRSHSTAVTVHGTAFSFTCGPEGSRVKLLRGKVAISRPESGKTVELTEGQMIVSDSAGISQPVFLSPDEKQSLEMLDDMARSALKNSPSADIADQAEKILSNSQNFLNEPAGGDSALAEISRKYGRISVIETQSGEKIIGAISYRDRSIMVITAKGSVTIPLSEINRIVPYNY